MVEGLASRGKATTFGVEEDEVVGEVGGRRDEEGLDIQGMKRFARYQVPVGDASFQYVAKALEGP